MGKKASRKKEQGPGRRSRIQDKGGLPASKKIDAQDFSKSERAQAYFEQSIQEWQREQRQVNAERERKREQRRQANPNWQALRADPAYQAAQAELRKRIDKKIRRRKFLESKSNRSPEEEQELRQFEVRYFEDSQDVLQSIRKLESLYGAFDRIEEPEELLAELREVNPDFTLSRLNRLQPGATDDVFVEETANWWGIAEGLCERDKSLPVLPVCPARGRDRHAALVHWCETAIRMAQRDSVQLGGKPTDAQQPAPSPSAPPSFDETSLRPSARAVWRALKGAIKNGKVLADELNTSVPEIRNCVHEIRREFAQSAIVTKRAVGYFRPDAPHDPTTEPSRSIKRRHRVNRR